MLDLLDRPTQRELEDWVVYNNPTLARADAARIAAHPAIRQADKPLEACEIAAAYDFEQVLDLLSSRGGYAPGLGYRDPTGENGTRLAGHTDCTHTGDYAVGLINRVVTEHTSTIGQDGSQ